MALATFLCVVSPVTLLLLAAMSEVERFHISENVAAGAGLSVLLLLQLPVEVDAHHQRHRQLNRDQQEIDHRLPSISGFSMDGKPPNHVRQKEESPKWERLLW